MRSVLVLLGTLAVGLAACTPSAKDGTSSSNEPVKSSTAAAQTISLDIAGMT